MDNIEQEPAGEAEFTPSEDNSSYDTQPVETTEESTTEVEEAGTASNPWDNDPKFKGKSPEEIYKAYKSVESLNGQLSQKAEVANLLEARGFTTQQIKDQMAQMDYAQQQERYANDPLAPVYDKVTALEQKLAQQESEKALLATERELDTFLKANPDYESSRDKLLKLSLTPGIGFDPKTGSETNFQELASEWIGQARAQGQQDAYKKIDTKVMTQATGASKGSPRARISPEDLDAMSHKDRIAAMESMYQHADTSNRPY